MKTTTIKKIFSLLLIVSLAIGVLFPASGFAVWKSDHRWQDDFTDIKPVGDAPKARVKLTSAGYEFTDWHFPTDYELTLPDGTVRTVSAKNLTQYNNTGPGRGSYLLQVSYVFDAEVDGEKYPICIGLTFQEKKQNCRFDICQMVSMTDDEDGSATSVPLGTIHTEECKTRVDKGTIFIRIAYWFYGKLLKINDFVEKHFHFSFLS